ncbi:hypothetical protein L0337_00280 [candidate division KSB1 bacterium]|nr:hypothetical protein [candidate division KSB1 bacterium]
MANKGIDFIPGCVELGDFDATSTTIGLDPCGELENIPQSQLNNTWVRDPSGVEIKHLPTYYGTLNYKMKMAGENLTIELDGDIKIPAGKIILKSPLANGVKAVVVNGKKSKSFNTKEVIVDAFPAKITMHYESR